MVHGHVAVDGRDADELELRVQGGEHDRHRVVRARVDVEDHLLRHGESVVKDGLRTWFAA